MSITLDQITKRYQNTPVVNDVSLEVGDGEFFVLLGASGSGKSTLLRTIAGLTGVDHGRISLHGRDVTHMSPRKREVGFVFQNYALFKHMSVADNIEFALRVRGVKSVARRARRQELLRLVALEGMDNRLPAQLSGGQQQRVAVARALAHKPQVLLMDEPFGALDAKIREELRRTIREVQRELKISTILVTHDQEEAFALADRIGVMNLGRLLEVGRPEELYARPATRFVATFLGAANLLLARQTVAGIHLGATPVTALLDKAADQRSELRRDHEVVAVLRPEEISLATQREALNSIYLGAGVVEATGFTGAFERLRVRMLEADKAAVSAGGDVGNLATLDVTRTQHEQRQLPLSVGQSVAVGVRRIHVLPTPLSSYCVYAATPGAAEALQQHTLLVDLATRMKTRITMQVEARPEFRLGQTATAAPSAALAGVAVIAASATAASQLDWLLQRGATEVLILPEQFTPTTRVLIHWIGEEVRRATLAVAASVLRHVAAEATYLNIQSGDETNQPAGMRELLDARSEAQAVHGLEMRTELHYGDAGELLQRELAERPDQMLILGVTDPIDFQQRFAWLLQQQPGWPVLLVFRGADSAVIRKLA
jgi:sulfate transport system ATP-binding protein